MYEMIVEILLPSIAIAVLCSVYSTILIEAGMILETYYILLIKLGKNYSWLSKPLGECVYCLCGQLSLWYYLYANWSDYSIFQHVIFIGFSLFFVEISLKILSWARN